MSHVRRRGGHWRWAGIGSLLAVSTFLFLATGASATTSGSERTTAFIPFTNVTAFKGHGKLAFVSRGRLWVLNGSTEALVAVSRPGQEAADPQFSRNGRWLIYVVDTNQLWLSLADGQAARRLVDASGGSWLPNGDLLTNTGVWRVSPAGVLSRVAAEPETLVAWAIDGSRFAFVTSTLAVNSAKPSHGLDRLELSSRLSGPRTVWYETPVSFSKASGFRGNFIAGVVVLPRRLGVLFQLDPGESASMPLDGLPLYVLRRPGGVPRRIGFTLVGWSAVSREGGLAIVNGGDRYAWVTKTVETCVVSRETCSSVHAPSGVLSFDPAFSPAGSSLAFVEAPSSSATNFFQPTLVRWYAMHTLWLLASGSSAPRKLPGTAGASVPTWSSNGKSLLYVSGDAVYLMPKLTGRPVKVAGPLFPPNAWPSYYGQINWKDQFAWSS